MTAGRSAPRYQIMALLYPRSKRLQSHLSEYFIVVVRLCHMLLKFTQKSTIGQFASSLSDSELKTYQSDFDLWANLIKEEVNYACSKKIEEEAEENTRFRALLSKCSKSASLEQKLKTKLRVLDFCSMYDYETPWKQSSKGWKCNSIQSNGQLPGLEKPSKFLYTSIYWQARIWKVRFTG